MKGQAKRFVSHKGASLTPTKSMNAGKHKQKDVSFFGLWLYATPWEICLTLIGCVHGGVSACALLAAVGVYGELTALFVARHRAAPPPKSPILQLFDGGEYLPEGNRTLHMEALSRDSMSFLWASFAIMAVQLVAAALAVALTNAAAGSMVSRLRRRLLAATLGRELSAFDTDTGLNFATAITENMERIKNGAGAHVGMCCHLGGSVVLGGGLALYNGWRLASAGLIAAPLAAAVAAFSARAQAKAAGKEASAYGVAASNAEEALRNVATVRAFCAEKHETERFAALLMPVTAASHARGAAAAGGAGVGWALTHASVALILWAAAGLLSAQANLPLEEQDYHPGVVITVMFCVYMSVQNLAMLLPHIEVFSRARGAAKSVYSLLSEEIRRRDVGAEPTFEGDIVFKDVFFNYPSRPAVKVLRGVSLKISPGQTVALVGPSGCGKSTLLQLLLRLYTPDSGSVTIDGYDVNDLHLNHYRTSIGVVGQEPVLFSGTIRENICLGRDDITNDVMIAAAKAAHAHQFIMKLAQGYDTPLTSGGASLSGGQKQRVALARALARRPNILLLDEPTSALDPASERQVQRALDGASKGRTTLVVSHRLSTIVNADVIVYIEQGAVLEAGTHRDLMMKKGLYWALVNRDMTTRSIPTSVEAVTASDADLDEVEDAVPTSAEDTPTHFVRSSMRHSNSRGSLSLRGSSRIGSVAALHGPLEEVMEQIPLESESSPTAPASFSALVRLSRGQWRPLAAAALASIAIGAIMPVFAVLFASLFETFSTADPHTVYHRSIIIAGLFLGAAVVAGAAAATQTALLARAGAALTARLRERLLRGYLGQEQAWFDRPENAPGALSARLAGDAAAVQGALGSCLGANLQGVATLVLGVALALPYSWKMTLVSLCSVPVVVLAISGEGAASRAAAAREARALAAAARLAAEGVTHVRTVHMLGVEQSIVHRYALSEDIAVRSTRCMQYLRGVVYGACLCAPTLGYAAALTYGGHEVAKGDIPYSSAILVSEALIYGAWMMAEALSFAPGFRAARRSAARVIAALERPPAIASADGALHSEEWKSSGAITFSDVHFSYPSRPTAPVLRGVTLHVPAGQTAALVGPSGSGKSTLMQLLMRCYDPSCGSIKLDDKDIRTDLSPHTLRRQFAVLPQEPAVWTRSLGENVAYGCLPRKADLHEVIEASKQADLHGFVASLPLGYDTVVGGAGASLSGGQKQRVALARALARRPIVLLLDEPTSALDAASEQSVSAALSAAGVGRTALVVAHRLATVRLADAIHVMDQGVIIESGTHEQLVARRGRYWALLQEQAPERTE